MSVTEELFLEKYRAGGFSKGLDSLGNSSYCLGLCFDDAANLATTVAGPCHASIFSDHPRKSIAIVLNKLKLDGVNVKGSELFFDWLVSKSAFKEAFLEKDPKVILSTKGIPFKTDYRRDAWLAAAQLARLSTSEYHPQFTTACRILGSFPELHPGLVLVLALSGKIFIKNEHLHVNGGGGNKIASNHLPFVLPGMNSRPLTEYQVISQACDREAEPSTIRSFREEGTIYATNSFLGSRKFSTIEIKDSPTVDLSSSIPQKLDEPMSAESKYNSPWKKAISDLYGSSTAAGNYLSIKKLLALSNKILNEK